MLADYADLAEQQLVTVAEMDGSLAGIVVSYPRGRALHVENVAVDPAFQGKGIGHVLMEFAEQVARSQGLAGVELYTNEVMTENIPFYEKRGYIIRERARQDGYDRIFFEKKLGDD